MSKNLTKKIVALSVASLLFGIQQLRAQTASADASSADGKNILKWNVAALATKSYSFQYERAVGNKVAVAIGYRFMPKSGIPFKSTINDWVDDEQTERTINNFKTSNFAITPEVRFYVGKGIFQGFYLAPFARYAKYNGEGPFQYDITQLNLSETIYFKGGINTYTAGLMIGAQWKLTKLLYLDWWIVGPNYGTAKGDLTGQKTLNALEQAEFKKQLDDFVEDLPLVHATAQVDGNGANIHIKGPWAGARAGLNIGFRF
ncbi:DUF3575 domain-containing protein [Pedobacter hartonius]|uniref:DUF3575 domain-containing protein n=1 Tax=Pedobacter hartonius TaxID=425514 RepID=A0A1H4H1E7_9SPHI|nr:DUF3575 domain-containing protein [Pedobacter hartonius]SEB15623.1 Protein of unknown function [Pedobacter hartonius]